MAMGQFNKDIAQKTGSNFIDQSGIYKGEITSAIEKVYESGSESITFNVKTDDDETAKYMRIFTKKKGGESSFGYNQVQSLMGILQIRDAQPIPHDDDMNYDCFCNRKIAFGLQRVNTPNDKYPFRMKIVHFLDYNTLQNYAEKTNNLPAKVKDREIEDITEESKGNTNQSQYNSNSDDDLPF
jgi:hypothetical protein